MRDLEIMGDLFDEYDAIQQEFEEEIHYISDDELRQLIEEGVGSVISEDFDLSDEDLYRDTFMEQYEEFNG